MTCPVSRCALIVTDMLNPSEHDDAEPLMESAEDVVPVLVGLIDAARRRDMLVIYVNDNHQDWTAGRRELTRAALEGAAPSLIEPLVPLTTRRSWSRRAIRCSTERSWSTCCASSRSSASSSRGR